MHWLKPDITTTHNTHTVYPIFETTVLRHCVAKLPLVRDDGVFQPVAFISNQSTPIYNLDKWFYFMINTSTGHYWCLRHSLHRRRSPHAAHGLWLLQAASMRLAVVHAALCRPVGLYNHYNNIISTTIAHSYPPPPHFCSVSHLLFLYYCFLIWKIVVCCRVWYYFHWTRTTSEANLPACCTQPHTRVGVM